MKDYDKEIEEIGREIVEYTNDANFPLARGLTDKELEQIEKLNKIIGIKE